MSSNHVLAYIPTSSVRQKLVTRRFAQFLSLPDRSNFLVVAKPTGSHVLDEAERSLHDALCVLSAATADSRVLYGGGWPEMQMAKVRALNSALMS